MKIEIMHPRYFWIILIILLAACDFGGANVRATQDTEENSLRTQSVMTLVVQLTETARPSNTPTLTATPLPTLTKTPINTPTPLPFVALDGFKIAYEYNHNIYTQESGQQSIQLTNSVDSHFPRLSNDGQKVIFYRTIRTQELGDVDQLYIVNSNGGEERALVTNDLLIALNLGYNTKTVPIHPQFVAGTHFMLFSTQTSSYYNFGDSRPTPNYDLLSVDMESGKIRQLLAPGKASYFSVAPNGKFIWVLSGDHIDLIGLDGQVRQRLKDYPALTSERDIAMPDLFWTHDSQKLSLALPPGNGYMDYALPEFRTNFWQYSRTNGTAIEIPLTPPAIDHEFGISPDGNWIVYAYFYVDGKNESTETFGIYLCDLRKGISQHLDLPGYDLIDFADTSYFWSPDSKHFIVQNHFRPQFYVVDVGGHMLTHDFGSVLNWIDNTRYFLRGAMGEIGKDNNVRIVELPSSAQQIRFFFPNH